MISTEQDALRASRHTVDVVKRGFNTGEIENAKSLIFEAASKEKKLSHLRNITKGEHWYEGEN